MWGHFFVTLYKYGIVYITDLTPPFGQNYRKFWKILIIL